MKCKYICMAAALVLAVSACDKVWEEEQYEQYVSFKAPVDNTTVTRIRVKYNSEGTPYNLPLLVSGTTVNSRDLVVHVGVDSDTLAVYNREHFGEGRKDLWYQEMPASRYAFNPVIHIPAGEISSLMKIVFDFNGLDFSENWLLPLKVEDDTSYNYQSNPRLNYNNALLWITPFNDYSGAYQATSLNVYANGNNNKLNLSTRSAHVINEHSVFFYAGAIEENREDRKLFKIKATFHPDENFVPEEGSDKTGQGIVTLEAMNNIAGLDFRLNGQPTYTVTENMDSEKPVLMRRVVTISNISYTFNDTKETPGMPVSYRVTGSMSLQRNINTIIPDEEFAIEWND